MANISSKSVKRQVRRNRIRAKVKGTEIRPRLCVFKSNKTISAQLIDDAKGETITAFTGLSAKGSKTDQAVIVGKNIAKQAIEKNIKKVVFDRGGYIYTGRVKALADAAREGGLEF